MRDREAAATELGEDRVVEARREHVQPLRVRRLEQHLHERRTTTLCPEVGAEHREVDGVDLVLIEPSLVREHEVPQIGCDSAPSGSVPGERGVGAEEGVQDCCNFFTATATRPINASNTMRRFMVRA